MQLAVKEQTFRLSENQALIILLCEGFASVAVQILLMRQLTPFVGSNALVNSMIIAVFLGALAMSYAVGGNVKKAQSSRLQKNLLASGCLLGIGVSYPFLSLFFEICTKYIDNPLISLSVYLLLIVGPMIYILGQTVPLLTNFVIRDRAAKVTGDSFNLSTWGNALGSLVTGLVVLYYFGIGWAVFINAIILIGISLYLASRLKIDFRTFAISLAAVTSILGLNVVNEKYHFITTTPYSNYQVVERQNARLLEINNSAASYIEDDGSVAEYIERIRNIMFDQMKLRNRDILVLGAGGFTLSHQGTSENRITYVDIDPDIRDIAEQHFLRSPIKGDFVSEDARVYVRKQKKHSYDVVVVDLYTNLATIPWHLATVEFYNEVRDIVAPSGYVLFNIIAYPWMDDPYSKRIDNTISAVFGSCRVSVGTYENSPTNIVYACSTNGSFERDKFIYSDTNSQGTHDSYVLSIRKQNAEGT